MSQATNILEMKRQLHDTNEAFLIQKQKYIEEDVKFGEKVKKLAERDLNYQHYLIKYQKELVEQRSKIKGLEMREMEINRQIERIKQDIKRKDSSIDKKAQSYSSEEKVYNTQSKWTNFIYKLVKNEMKTSMGRRKIETPNSVEINLILDSYKITKQNLEKLKEEQQKCKSDKKYYSDSIEEHKSTRKKELNEQQYKLFELDKQKEGESLIDPYQEDFAKKKVIIEQELVDLCIKINLLASICKEFIYGSSYTFDVYTTDYESMASRVKDTMDNISLIEKVVEFYENYRKKNIIDDTKKDNKEKSEIDSSERKDYELDKKASAQKDKRKN